MNEPMWYRTMVAALIGANDGPSMYDQSGHRVELKDAPASNAKSIEFRVNLSDPRYTTVYSAESGEFLCVLNEEAKEIVVKHALNGRLAIKGMRSTYGSGVTEWDSEWSEGDDDEEEEEDDDEDAPRPNMLGLAALVRSNVMPIYNPRTKEIIHPNDALISSTCRESGAVMQMEREDGFTPVLCQCHRLVRFLILPKSRAVVEEWMARQPANTIEVIEPEAATRP